MSGLGRGNGPLVRDAEVAETTEATIAGIECIFKAPSVPKQLLQMPEPQESVIFIVSAVVYDQAVAQGRTDVAKFDATKTVKFSQEDEAAGLGKAGIPRYQGGLELPDNSPLR